VTVREIHPPCPKCFGEGQPRAVTHKDGLRIVTYECEHCHQHWEITSPAAPHDWTYVSPRLARVRR